MLRFFLLGIILLLGPVAVQASSSLDNARKAAALVGPDTWTRVLKIENTARPSRYPRTVHALVFEFGGLLWFYADVDGTQSFSLHLDDLAAEKADFAPLLRAIEPGFTAYTELPATDAELSAARIGELPNGCFIDCVAALRASVNRGDLIVRARLLSFYGRVDKAPFGHTVLAYETSAGAFVLDPQANGSPAWLSRRLPDDPWTVAAAARPDASVTVARWVPTKVPRPFAVAAVSDLQAPRMDGRRTIQ